jgi:hypothetical protein
VGVHQLSVLHLVPQHVSRRGWGGGSLGGGEV